MVDTKQLRNEIETEPRLHRNEQAACKSLLNVIDMIDELEKINGGPLRFDALPPVSL